MKKIKTKKVKASKVSLQFINRSKHERLMNFIEAYRKATIFYINHIWNNEIKYEYNGEQKLFSIQKDLLYLPKYLSTIDISLKTNLSARALKCAMTQAIGIINSYTDDRRKLLYLFSQTVKKGERTRSITKQLKKNELKSCPNDKNIHPELNSICCEYEDSIKSSSFDGFLILHSLGKEFGKIIIPINKTKHSRKLENKGRLLKSFQICTKHIAFKYEIPISPIKEIGEIRGADQGIITCVSLSDRQITKECNHGHDLHSIDLKIKRKKTGSKAFHKALAHQENYINWSINQLNLTNIKELRLEKISNFRYKKNVGKFLNHFGETLIREKLIDVAQDAGVRLIEQSSAYRSQRCSDCGYVCKSNRRGKLFSCKRCGYQADADFNASRNHEQDLPATQPFLQRLKIMKEFFWIPEGLFTLDGAELTVPLTKKKNNSKNRKI